MEGLQQLGFYTCGFGCMSCIGNSGPILDAMHEVADEIELSSVLSGNRNFDGRISPDVSQNYLSAPAGVIAYALAGTMDFDFETQPLGTDAAGNPVFLRDLWPSNSEVRALQDQVVTRELFDEAGKGMLEGTAAWQELGSEPSDLFNWGPDSTYVRRATYFEGMGAQPAEAQAIAELEKLDMRELVAEARRLNLEPFEGENRRDLVVRALRAKLRQNGLMYGEGTLEILPDEFGFLRSPQSRYLSCPDDIYISPSQIRRFGLRDGLTIFGQIRPPKERERYFALLRVESINDEDPNALASKPFFDDLIAEQPRERVPLETTADAVDERVVDLLAPLGFGQRGLIISPARAGKTTLIQKMAKSVVVNRPDCNVFVARIDERPEEITDLERRLSGPRCEVVGSTFDEPPCRATQVAQIVLEKAKRMVECGRDVILFLDSFTRLVRAWNAEAAAPPRDVQFGRSRDYFAPEVPREIPDPDALFDAPLRPMVLQRAKRYFGAARKIDGGGSLTIVATIHDDPERRFDREVLEEFCDAGNWRLRLVRDLAEKRVW
ncbi:MAG: transcription termination factor Rho, partial [Thermoguttaceae bacterium]|nr:transcription termination factor Rho [Thermoguttaceae bacterium]